MPKLTIDGQEIEVPAGTTIMQAAEQLSIEIPFFCYHSKLNIAGNCRMCLVEVESNPKPIASCAMPIADGMIVHTKSPKTKKAQAGVMEFLLINHPLDCPICDQGGECDLQDQAMAYGYDTSRYSESKLAVRDKNMGPLILTFMNRCIHCTRCVRFATDIAGVPELGAIGRGENMEIISYLDRTMTSELSGNVIDLCPVGALTSKPYAFKGRSWELTKTESIDVMDAVGSNIRVDTYGPQVLRILPCLNDDINEEWISDKTRFACDGLNQQRLDKPYLKIKGKLQPVTWEEAFAAIKRKLKGVSGKQIGAIAGDQVDVEAMTVLKDLLIALGSSNYDCRQDGIKFDTNVRSHYLFNTTIAGIEQADACLIIGAHPRYDAPIINARLRKRYLMGDFPIGRIAGTVQTPWELTYPFEQLGDDPRLIDSNHPFAKKLEQAKNPMIIIGKQALQRHDGMAILAQAAKLAETCKVIRDDWNGFNVLHTAAARIGGLDIGFVPEKDGLDIEGMSKAELKVLFLLGVDELDMTPFKKSFVIYQGHHGDMGAAHADVILPGAAYTEKSGTYVNTEGRVQRTQPATFPPGEAKEDWKILRALSEVLDKTLPYDTLEQVRHRMAAINHVFTITDYIKPTPWQSFKHHGKIDKLPLAPWHGNFYMTDPISRNSVTMAKCSQELNMGGVNG